MTQPMVIATYYVIKLGQDFFMSSRVHVLEALSPM